MSNLHLPDKAALDKLWFASTNVSGSLKVDVQMFEKLMTRIARKFNGDGAVQVGGLLEAGRNLIRLDERDVDTTEEIAGSLHAIQVRHDCPFFASLGKQELEHNLKNDKTLGLGGLELEVLGRDDIGQETVKEHSVVE